MYWKCKKLERPESYLKGFKAGLQHYCITTYGKSPFDYYLNNFITALIKSDKKCSAQRTGIMPVQPFAKLFGSWDNHVIEIGRLRQKCISLLALCCMLRPSDIAPQCGFYRNQIKFNEDKSVTLTLFGIKNDYDRKGFEIRIQPADDPNICPISCLYTYLARTKHITPHSGPVFVSTTTPYKAISATTVSDILRKSIREAGLHNKGFTPRHRNSLILCSSLISPIGGNSCY